MEEEKLKKQKEYKDYLDSQNQNKMSDKERRKQEISN